MRDIHLCCGDILLSWRSIYWPIRSSHCSMALFVNNYMCWFYSRHRRSSLWILIPVCQHNRFASTRGQELGIRIVRCIHRSWFTNTSMCHDMTMLLVRGHMKIWRGCSCPLDQLHSQYPGPIMEEKNRPSAEGTFLPLFS